MRAKRVSNALIAERFIKMPKYPGDADFFQEQNQQQQQQGNLDMNQLNQFADKALNIWQKVEKVIEERKKQQGGQQKDANTQIQAKAEKQAQEIATKQQSNVRVETNTNQAIKKLKDGVKQLTFLEETERKKLEDKLNEFERTGALGATIDQFIQENITIKQ